MKAILLIMTGFILGIGFTLFLAMKLFPAQMIISKESKLGYDETVKMIEEKTEQNGWAVLKEWDLTKRMENAGYEGAPTVKVIELCNAQYTYDVLKNRDDRFIAAIMPYRIAVYELENGKVMISKMNIGLLSRFFSSNIENVMGNAADDDIKILNDIIIQ